MWYKCEKRNIYLRNPVKCDLWESNKIARLYDTYIFKYEHLLNRNHISVRILILPGKINNLFK